MDCRNFKEMLDSYLCDELAVETNHSMQRHGELCPSCRQEMGSRRQLRYLLRQVCSKEKLSAQSYERICTRLRSSESVTRSFGAGADSIRQNFFGRISPRRFSIGLVPAISVLTLVVFISGTVGWYLIQHQRNKQSPAGSELSDLIVGQAVGDHVSCASKFAKAIASHEIPGSIKALDPSYVDLDQVISQMPSDLLMHSAHICSFGGRQFVHLVYTRDSHLISLLVTERDAQALKITSNQLPNGYSRTGMQQALPNDLELKAYQSPRHVIFLVSEQSVQQGQYLAETLAMPIVDHLRRVESNGLVGSLGLDNFIVGLVKVREGGNQ